MKVLLTRSNKPVSWLIRVLTWSRYSHCGVLQEDLNTVIHSTMLKGVHEVPLREFIAMYDVVDQVEIQGNYRKARELLGCGYDHTALVGILFKRKWNELNDWFCSEVAAYCDTIFAESRVGRIVPEHIFMIGQNFKRLKG